MFKFLDGYKTKIILGLFVVAMALLLFSTVTIPEEVWAMLVALGFAGIRSAMAAISGNKGWQTYVAAGATIAISVCSMVGVSLPLTEIYAGLTAFGVKGVRDAVKKLE